MVGGHPHQMLGLLAEKRVAVNEKGPNCCFATDRESGLDLIFADDRK